MDAIRIDQSKSFVLIVEFDQKTGIKIRFVPRPSLVRPSSLKNLRKGPPAKSIELQNLSVSKTTGPDQRTLNSPLDFTKSARFCSIVGYQEVP